MDSNWKKLEHISQLTDLKKESTQKPVLVFKHSIRCSISAMVWDRLQRNWKDEDSQKIIPYYLDLINHRAISDAIAQEYHVQHQSPQVIIIKNGEATYDNSHMGINYSEIIGRSIDE